MVIESEFLAESENRVFRQDRLPGQTEANAHTLYKRVPSTKLHKTSKYNDIPKLSLIYRITEKSPTQRSPNSTTILPYNNGLCKHILPRDRHTSRSSHKLRYIRVTTHTIGREELTISETFHLLNSLSILCNREGGNSRKERREIK